MGIQFIVGLVVMGVPIALFGLNLNRMSQREKEYSRSPFSEKLLRPPGESLRLKIDELGDRLLYTVLRFAGLIVLPGFFVMAAPMQSPSGILVAYLSIPCVCYALAILQWRKLVQLRHQLRNCRLGFDGERYIGAELNRLMGEYHVFHDFVYDRRPGGEATNFNIDHIVVGPNGIFAIETKAKRKKFLDGKSPGHLFEVDFDGASLDFSSGFRNTAYLRQARDEAKTLSEWLNGSSETAIKVQPVIAIPGWKVTRTGKGDVTVLSGKNIAYTLSNLSSDRLEPATIRAIASRIEDHCRNVEGG